MAFLVLNENREFDASFQKALEPFNERCEIFREEREFLERLQKGNVRAIVIVIYTEILDGLLVLEKIRKNTNLASVPLIAVSQLRHPLPFIDAYERGADEYFAFPINESEFTQKIRKLVKV